MWIKNPETLPNGTYWFKSENLCERILTVKENRVYGIHGTNCSILDLFGEWLPIPSAETLEEVAEFLKCIVTGNGIDFRTAEVLIKKLRGPNV